MATLILQAAGATLGGLFGPVGAMIGRAAGALAGNLIDRSVIAGFTTIDGTRLPTARISGAEEGTAINRVYGTARIGGTLIWATRFEEEVTVERSGGKATGPRVETFSYFANFAVGLCEGPIAAIRRVWADGQEIDLTAIEMRLYRGTEGQEPDPLIEAKQGAGSVPAYRGLAYVVFERLPLDLYGNRIPVLQFEVIRIVGSLESRIRAITIIPGATEHGYSPFKVKEQTGDASARIINRNQLYKATDWDASIDELMAVCPNLERVALVVSWFGTDLRAGHCRILPGVETSARDDESTPWQVAGYARAAAHEISWVGGGPAYGGTPNDASVVAAIRNLKARGLKVHLYPLLMMDIPADNGRADPEGADEQPSYPWRGRITCHPAPGRAGSADKSAEAQTQINAFFGDVDVGDFDVAGETVSYSGSDEGYKRMILHYALLAEAAGGVHGFAIGSELRGLTQVRNGAGNFPFISKLVALADDVRGIVGPATKLTYAADWSEYFGYHPDDGTGDVFFNLDPLWSSNAIDAVGIDNYMPLADFRDDDFTGVNPDGARLADDKAALKAAIASGEGYDWYYASGNARSVRNRTAITDGLAGKPWIFRYKDIEGWWSHRHFDRVDGHERASPTDWTPAMKPVWFTEVGCPAIERGANQPNAFIDRKSSESTRPHFSDGKRSDEMQRRFLEAHHEWWSGSDAPAGMVAPDHLFVWAWDARAWPAFPEDEDLYADGVNWARGHWMNGRLGAGTLSSVIAAVLKDNGITDFDVSRVSGDLKGYVMGGQASARDLLAPLVTAFRLDVTDINGTLRFQSRGLLSSPAAIIDVFADADDEVRWSEMIGQDGDFAGEAIVDYQSEVNEYQDASARSRRLQLANDRVLRLGLPGVLDEDAANQMAEGLLRDHRLSRRQVSFALSPSAIEYEPGDVVSLYDGPDGRFLITRIEDGAMRQIEAREVGSGDGAGDYTGRKRRRTGRGGDKDYAPVLHFMDLARYRDGPAIDFACAAVTAKPWRRSALSVSAESENYDKRAVVTRPARTGRLQMALEPGPTAVTDWKNVIRVRMIYGGLSSVSALAQMNGANRIAVRAENGEWEIIGFRVAEEVSANVWNLSGLLRGIAGTEDAMAAGTVAGAPLVVLDQSITPLGLETSEAGLTLNWIAEAFGSAGGKVGPIAFAGGMRAEMPLAPAHLDAVRKPTGDIALSWVRRARIGADAWEGDEIALDEPNETYRLELLGGGAVVRTVSVASSNVLYTQGMEHADFGGMQASVSFRVRQKGARVALGIAAERTVIL
ncbi:glycoside hydrolase/phage tail family protein [Rhizobium sp. KVB221]|uniref:Glycoside hydrolase/phage tail family protein n=1 Tax=Rhizobium setariae TaxID=2801340 RepID=A0A936YR78_9HYPH|nr:glycoside hydrolase TIM-barrel-like domain-containing protein [Rhizobium setariae]MBL0371082.1 glycoside hydrolase/phage tail family protein [Rhizobium setariae]